MADKHPYISGAGGLVAAVTHLRKSFPQKVSAETFKKLGIAPNNETYIVNILRFLSVIDAEGNKTKTAGAVFVKHDEEEFQQGFADLVKEAYASLFELHGANAWNTPTDKLISFFRSSDQTSDVVGRRQANTFQTLASISGKLDNQASKPVASKAKKPDTQGAKKRQAKAGQKAPSPAAETAATSNSIFGSSGGGQNRDSAGGEMALTVRIEINLPANGDKETYDNIFRSIRENLLNGKSA